LGEWDLSRHQKSALKGWRALELFECAVLRYTLSVTQYQNREGHMPDESAITAESRPCKGRTDMVRTRSFGRMVALIVRSSQALWRVDEDDSSTPVLDPCSRTTFPTQPATGVFGRRVWRDYTSAQLRVCSRSQCVIRHCKTGPPDQPGNRSQNSAAQSPGSPADRVTSPVTQTKPNCEPVGAYYASDGYRFLGKWTPGRLTWNEKLVDGSTPEIY